MGSRKYIVNGPRIYAKLCTARYMYGFKLSVKSRSTTCSQTHNCFGEVGVDIGRPGSQLILREATEMLVGDNLNEGLHCACVDERCEIRFSKIPVVRHTEP